MNVFKNIQGLSIFWRKVVVFGILMILAIPIGFLIGKSFQEKTEQFKKEEFVEDLNLPGIKEEMKKLPLEEIGETKERLEEELRRIEEMVEQNITSTTSSDQVRE